MYFSCSQLPFCIWGEKGGMTNYAVFFDESFLTSSSMEGISLKLLANRLNKVLQTANDKSTTLNEQSINFQD